MKKTFAVKGLIALAITLALCMFFARTVQSITTPKVKLVSAQNGRLEQKTPLKAEVVFPSSEPYVFTEAMAYNVVIQKVYAKAGFPVEEGELLFTAVMPDYEKVKKELRDEYEEKAAELAAKDAENLKRKKESERNARYRAMMDAQDALSEARIQARAAALRIGIDLEEDIDLWADAAKGNEALEALVERVEAANADYRSALERYYETYTRSKYAVSDEVYEYILARDKILAEMGEIEARLSALEAARQSLTEVRAPRGGFIATMDVSEGDTYDGKKAAFTMDDPASPPVLRASAEYLKKAVEPGARAVVKGDYDEINTSVIETGIGNDGKRYIDMELTEQLLSARGGLYAMIRQGQIDVNLIYRAAQTSTLLPASAVRTDESGDYVFLVVRSSGGLMGDSLKLRRQSVTVLDKSDKMVSIAEELSYESIADKEDRAIEENARVMEYAR